jgi:putative chitinase
MTKLSATTLLAAAPDASPDTWMEPLQAAFDRWGMDTAQRIAAALGQFAAEAGPDFREIVENMNYSHAERLVAVFPRRFPTLGDAQPYVGHPEKIANRVYSGKLGNGNEASGDGGLFRGRGLIQITGRDEYTAAAEAMGMTPEAVAAYAETPDGAAQTACWYLAENNCLHFADVWNIDRITEAVNGAAMLAAQERRDASEAALQTMLA